MHLPSLHCDGESGVISDRIKVASQQNAVSGGKTPYLRDFAECRWLQDLRPTRPVQTASPLNRHNSTLSETCPRTNRIGSLLSQACLSAHRDLMIRLSTGLTNPCGAMMVHRQALLNDASHYNLRANHQTFRKLPRGTQYRQPSGVAFSV